MTATEPISAESFRLDSSCGQGGLRCVSVPVTKEMGTEGDGHIGRRDV
jgi:hypothetical protein